MTPFRAPQDAQLARLTTVEPGDVAVGYSRVSTEDNAKGTSHEKQEAFNREGASFLGIPLLDNRRDTQTGRILYREGLAELLEMLSDGKANILFIYDIDRLSRKYTGYVNLREKLHKSGIKIFVTRDKKWLSPNAKDRLGEDIRALVGDVEWETIRERTSDGAWRKINERKQMLAGGVAPYGYRWAGYGRTRELEIDDEAAKVVRLIFQLYVYGDGRGPMSTVQIAQYLENRGIKPQKKRGDGARCVWAISTLQRILSRAAYYGEFEHYQYRTTKNEDGTRTQRTRDKSERVSVPCPQIIEKPLWEAAQSKLAEGREKSARNTKYEYLMARRLKCMCGYHIAATGGKKTTLRKDGTPRAEKPRWYKCGGKRGDRYVLKPCTNKGVRQDYLDAAVWEWVKTHLTDPNWVGHQLREERNIHTDEQLRLQEQVDALLNERNLIEETLGGLFIDKNRYKQLAHILEQQIETENAKLERVNKELQELQPLIREELTDDAIEAVEQWVGRYQRAAENASFAERRQFIEFMDVRGEVLEEPNGVYVKLTCRLPIEDTIPIVSTTSAHCAARRS